MTNRVDTPAYARGVTKGARLNTPKDPHHRPRCPPAPPPPPPFQILPIDFDFAAFNEHLFKMVKGLKAAHATNPAVSKLAELALTMHRYCMAERSRRNGLVDLWV